MSDSRTVQVPQSPLVGGPSEVKDADEEIQKLCDEVKPQVEQTKNVKFEVYEAKQYKSQVVSGMNYMVKVHVGEEEYVYLKIYKKLPCYGGTVELSEVHQGKPPHPLWSF